MLAVFAATFFATASALAQSGGLQITPDPPRVPAPPLLPLSPPLSGPLSGDYIPKRTPQFEIWRSVDVTPFRPVFQLRHTELTRVAVATGEVFLVRLYLPGLAAGTNVLAQGNGELAVVDSPGGLPVRVPTDTSRCAVFTMSFPSMGRDGLLLVGVDGVKTILRLRRTSP